MRLHGNPTAWYLLLATTVLHTVLSTRRHTPISVLIIHHTTYIHRDVKALGYQNYDKEKPVLHRNAVKRVDNVMPASFHHTGDESTQRVK